MGNILPPPLSKNPRHMNKEQSSFGSDQIEMVSTPAFARPPSTSGHTPSMGKTKERCPALRKGAHFFKKKKAFSLQNHLVISVFSGEHFVSFWGEYKWSFLLFFVFQVRADDGFGSENQAGKLIWKVEV